MDTKTKRELELEEFLRKTYWTLRTYLVSHASAADWAHKAVQLQEKIDAILGEGLAVAYGGGGDPGSDANPRQPVGDTGA